MNIMNNTINEIFNVMNFVVNDIASETISTVSEACELISAISKFMIGKKDDSAKAEMSSIISSIDDLNLLGLHLFKIELSLSYANEQIALISGSSDSAWKIMYLISELFQSLNSAGNKANDVDVNKNNQSDEKTELKNKINELKELAEFFDIAVISAQQLNRVGASVVDTTAIEMRTEIITLVQSYCNMYGYNVQFITLNEDGRIVTIDNVTN